VFSAGVPLQLGSGSPAGDLLITGAVYEDASDGLTVLHCPVPMNDAGVTVLDNWRAMGMRDSGSNEVVLDNVFIAEDAVYLRRPRGKWHPFFTLAMTIANPLIMSAHVGVAEAARDVALQHLQRKRDDADVWYLVGEMENALTTAQMAVQSLIDLCANCEFTPHRLFSVDGSGTARARRARRSTVPCAPAQAPAPLYRARRTWPGPKGQ
jgi:alkylation response protein AidB-like acyl-CoA dehydrogenase